MHVGTIELLPRGSIVIHLKFATSMQFEISLVEMSTISLCDFFLTAFRFLRFSHEAYSGRGGFVLRLMHRGGLGNREQHRADSVGKEAHFWIQNPQNMGGGRG